jgi:hypothetical protein
MQQLLTIGGIIIFTFLILSFNSSSINQSAYSDFNEAILVATGLGQGLIEEIHSKAFDENTVSSAVDDISNLSPIYELKYDSGEITNTTFDDVDDYNGYSRDYTDKLFDNFNASVKVYYVNESNPAQSSSIQTFAKKVTITISNPYLTIKENESVGTLEFSSIITY